MKPYLNLQLKKWKVLSILESTLWLLYIFWYVIITMIVFNFFYSYSYFTYALRFSTDIITFAINVW